MIMSSVGHGTMPGPSTVPDHCKVYVLPVSLQYKGRPLVIYIRKSIVAVVIVASVGYIMMFVMSIFHLALLLCVIS